jgi:molybdenum cofactor cytidylyltransferase
LVEYSLDTAIVADVGDVFIVTYKSMDFGPYYDHLVTKVVNSSPKEGISSSISVGISRISRSHDSCIIMLADQPFVPASHIRSLYQKARREKIGIVYTKCEKRFGNPAYFQSKYFQFMQSMTGDSGAKSIISDNFHDSRYLDIVDCRYLIDIDNPEDLLKAEKIYNSLFPKGFM